MDSGPANRVPRVQSINTNWYTEARFPIRIGYHDRRMHFGNIGRFQI